MLESFIIANGDTGIIALVLGILVAFCMIFSGHK